MSANLKTIINDSATIKKLKGQVIQKELALISIDNKPTIYKNSITLLQGKSGTNKSRLAQTIVSNLICKKDTYNGLNIYSNSNELVAVYIDTERNIFNQFPRSIQDIIMAAGFDKSEDPKNLEYTSLIKISRESRQISIEEYIKHLQSKYSQHLFIVLDVITDCLGDFNNSSDSLGLVDYLNKL
ncbi:MAG: hypothetical protein KC414_10950, partial [Romboutsia sp.]|nr:hypothetical protein [Romboutsia sp.]